MEDYKLKQLICNILIETKQARIDFLDGNHDSHQSALPRIFFYNIEIPALQAEIKRLKQMKYEPV